MRYWQAENEPNSPVFWAGTAQEYIDQLKVFYQTVKDADPSAVVILAGSDGLFNPADPQPNDLEKAGLDFFDHLLREGREYFDVFDLHLYGDPYTIPARIEFMRRKMAALGYQKPIFAGEYNGPGFFDFAENWPYIEMMVGFMTSIMATDNQAQTKQNTSEHDTMAALYARMATLPPQTQMFMQGCPPAMGTEAPSYQLSRPGNAQPARALGRRPEDALLQHDLPEWGPQSPDASDVR